MFESWLQAILQVISMMDYGVSDGNDSRTSRIFSLTISFLSILYGMSTFNLRVILRYEASIIKTFRFALIELSTSAVIILYISVVYAISMTLMLTDNLFHKVMSFVVLFGIPVCLSIYVSCAGSKIWSIDYRVDMKYSGMFAVDKPFTEMVRTRRYIVIINIIYLLTTSSVVTITLYLIKLNPTCIIQSLTCENVVANEQFRSMVVILSWYTAFILSFLQNIVELLIILIANKSFLDWAFTSALEEVEILAGQKEQERLDKLKEYNLFLEQSSLLLGRVRDNTNPLTKTEAVKYATV